MDKAIDVSWRKDKTAAELERIFAQAVLADSYGLGAFAGLHVVSAQQMQQVGVAQLDGAIGLAFFVDEERKGDSGLLAEVAGVTDVAQSDGDDFCAFGSDGLLVFAQLRDVLTAEDSTVMAQKDDHGRAVSPQRAEPNGVAVDVRQSNVGKPAAE